MLICAAAVIYSRLTLLQQRRKTGTMAVAAFSTHRFRFLVVAKRDATRATGWYQS